MQIQYLQKLLLNKAANLCAFYLRWPSFYLRCNIFHQWRPIYVEHKTCLSSWWRTDLIIYYIQIWSNLWLTKHEGSDMILENIQFYRGFSISTIASHSLCLKLLALLEQWNFAQRKLKTEYKSWVFLSNACCFQTKFIKFNLFSTCFLNPICFMKLCFQKKRF